MSGRETNQRIPAMKTLVAVAALIAAVASPAFAQTARPAGAAVISGNQYLGSDPDPNVRFDLRREAGTRNGSF
jgi:hypothetical protein